MISFISGSLVEKFPTYVVIDCHGVGFHILIPVSTYEALGPLQEPIQLLTYLLVREDALTLYGFASREERQLFLDLLSVSGVGPKLALGILSKATVPQVYRLIAEQNEAGLVKIKGLGKKTAQRLILDLKEKAAERLQSVDVLPDTISQPSAENLEQTVLAMMSLGYNKTEAETAASRARHRAAPDASIQDLLRIALSGE